MHVVHVVHVAGLVHSCSAAPWCLRADYDSQAEQVRAKRVQPMDARNVWQVDKLFMGAAQTVGGVGGQEQREHAAQLLLQTGPVSSVDAEALLIRPRCTRSKMCCWQRRRTITPPLFWVQPLQLCSQQALGVACCVEGCLRRRVGALGG